MLTTHHRRVGVLWGGGGGADSTFFKNLISKVGAVHISAGLSKGSIPALSWTVFPPATITDCVGDDCGLLRPLHLAQSHACPLAWIANSTFLVHTLCGCGLGGGGSTSTKRTCLEQAGEEAALALLASGVIFQSVLFHALNLVAVDPSAKV